MAVPSKMAAIMELKNRFVPSFWAMRRGLGCGIRDGLGRLWSIERYFWLLVKPEMRWSYYSDISVLYCAGIYRYVYIIQHNTPIHIIHNTHPNIQWIPQP